MKKSLFFVAAASALMLTACSSENDVLKDATQSQQTVVNRAVGFDIYTPSATVTRAGLEGTMTTNRMQLCNAYMQESHDAIVAKEKSRRRKIVLTIAALLVFIAGLSIFAWWARKEQKNAEEQKTEAETQKNLAEQAQKDAQQQRDEVKKMLQEVTDAKNRSDSLYDAAENARKDAVAAQMDALIARNEALNALIRAMLEQDKAERN